ncbi:flagellin [Rhizobium sp. LjRoot30]|uniref:flagellin N-terminal helical domain-containing protein n=1 Tax=Rhizobium sp. LjRoot30 TaxID=3342320 RepID=UPI003ECDC874
MASILTNSAAISALNVLRSVNTDFQNVQQQVSSGLRVKTASDNAAYWSIATTMRSDKKALSAIQDGLAVSAGILDTAYTGMSNALDVMDEIKAKLVTAREPGVDKRKINTELDQLKQQLLSIAASSSFSGQNWLWMDDPSDPAQNGVKKLPASFVRDNNGNVSIKHIEFDMTAVFDTDHVFYLVSDGGCDGIITNSGFATQQGFTNDWVLVSGRNHTGHPEITLTDTTPYEHIEEMTTVVELMIGRMTDVASMFGALSGHVSRSNEFLSDLSGTIERGIGRLVDADMNEVSTRLKALQTQQQLGIQALQIANTNADSIMQLFS